MYTFQWENFPDDQQYDNVGFRVRTLFATELLVAFVAQSGDEFIGSGEVEDHSINVNFSSTAVTIGEVDLQAVSVADYLKELGARNIGTDYLTQILRSWDPAAADALVNGSQSEVFAALAEFLDPDGDDQFAMLQWNTLSEQNTFGFYVERQSEDGSWVTVNQKMMPSLVTAPLGGHYMLADPEAVSGQTYQYQIREVEDSGDERLYGPYPLTLQGFPE